MISTGQLLAMLLESVYALAVILPCIYIFVRIRRIFLFSRYRGLAYFSYAFLFIAIAFMLRYAVMIGRIYILGDGSTTISSFGLLTTGMEFFIILPGLFFLYSLVWKRFEDKRYSAGWFSPAILSLLMVSLLIAIADYLMQSLLLMYASQIIIFFLASAVSFGKYQKNKSRHMLAVFSCMAILLIVWIVNMIAQYTIDDYPVIRIITYSLTVSAVMIFLRITSTLSRGF